MLFSSQEDPRGDHHSWATLLLLRVSTEINFDFQQNFWSKLSKVIGILILMVGIEIPISNQNRNVNIFQWKMLWNFDIDIGIWYQNQNLDVRIKIPTLKSKSKPKFWFWHQNRNWNSDLDIEILTKSDWTFHRNFILTRVNNRNWNRHWNSDFDIEIEIPENWNFNKIMTKLCRDFDFIESKKWLLWKPLHSLITVLNFTLFFLVPESSG
jgi:hypothetical protein